MTPEQFTASRKAMNLTQKQLAAHLRMGKSGWQSIGRWESGAVPVPGPVEVAIGHLLNQFDGAVARYWELLPAITAERAAEKGNEA